MEPQQREKQQKDVLFFAQKYIFHMTTTDQKVDTEKIIFRIECRNITHGIVTPFWQVEKKSLSDDTDKGNATTPVAATTP